MIPALIGIAVLLIVMLIAVRIGIKKGKSNEDSPSLMIHASGIYSVIRKSPRESIGKHKPSEEEILKYFAGRNVNMVISPLLSETDKSTLMSKWNSLMEANISEIEKGDEKGIQFYYYDFDGEDPVCSKFISKGRFVTREEIYRHPMVIPPFHLGCGCRLKQFEGKARSRDSEAVMLPLFSEKTPPPLPDWKEIHLESGRW